MSKEQKFNNNTIKIVIISLLGAILGICFMGFNFIAVQNFLSPFKTEEEKQAKPIYQAAMKGISDFRLSSVDIDSEYHRVLFFLKLKHRTTASEAFNEEQLLAINQSVEQLMAYLNEVDQLDDLYTGYNMIFTIGNSDIQTICFVDLQSDQYEFNYLFNSTANVATDYHMMKKVRLIDNDRCFQTVFEYEKVSKFSDCHNLEKIIFNTSSDYGQIIEFAKAMHTVLPKCKIFIKEEEVVVTN